jgi:hypothetical protein
MADLPQPPPASLATVPTPSEILEHPSIEERKQQIPADIRDQTFVDIDPGVFDEELIKLGIFTKLDPHDPSKPAVYQDGNIETGSYSGTQAALTHLYSRIERT